MENGKGGKGLGKDLLRKEMRSQNTSETKEIQEKEGLTFVQEATRNKK